MNCAFLFLLTGVIYCTEEAPLSKLNPTEQPSSNSPLVTTSDIESTTPIEKNSSRSTSSWTISSPVCEKIFLMSLNIIFITSVIFLVIGIVKPKYYYLAIVGIMSFFFLGMIFGLYQYIDKRPIKNLAVKK